MKMEQHLLTYCIEEYEKQKEKEKKKKGWFQGFGLRSWKDGAASYWDGNAVGETI